MTSVSVWPSGGCWVRYVHPILPPPPGLFTTVVETSISFFSCNMRSINRRPESDADPAPEAETNSTFRDGFHCWESTGGAASAKPSRLTQTEARAKAA
jgi:hypothetical protein